MFIRVSGSASCYSGVAGGWTDECTVNYCLASWYSGSASSNHNGWEGTLCVACDARKQGVSHSLMSPLSLRADSHSETLTGCPEDGARVMEERRRKGERRKCDIKTIREIPNLSRKARKKKTSSFLLRLWVRFASTKRLLIKATTAHEITTACKPGPERHLDRALPEASHR